MTHMTKKDIREGDGNKGLHVKHQKETAIRELDLMHKAIDAREYKKAIHHKKLANVAIDEMVGAE
jgi:hypothetical protein